MITSLTRPPSTPARVSAAWIAVFPSSWAGRLAKAPLNAPTGVRVALTMTISSFIGNSFWRRVRSKMAVLALPHVRQAGRPCQHEAERSCTRELALN